MEGSLRVRKGQEGQKTSGTADFVSQEILFLTYKHLTGKIVYRNSSKGIHQKKKKLNSDKPW